MTAATESAYQEIRGLSESGDPDAPKKILAIMLDNEDPDVRVAAARALGELHGAPPATVLGRVSKSDDAEKRLRAVETLSHLAGPDAVEPLIAALRDTHDRVRAKAAQGLGRLADPRASVALVSMLADRDQLWDTQLEAADALAQLGMSESVDPIVEWAERFYAMEIDDLAAQDKCTIVHNLLLGLFEKLPEEDLLLQTVHIGKKVNVKASSIVKSGSTQATCWLFSEFDDPVGTAVKAALAGRNGEAGEAGPSDDADEPAPARSAASVLDDFDFLGGGGATTKDADSQPAPAAESGDDMGNTHREPPPPGPTAAQSEEAADDGSPVEPPVARGALAALLAAIAERELPFVAVGRGVAALVRGESPANVDLTVQFDVPSSFKKRLDDPLEWNRQFHEPTEAPLAALAEILGVGVPDLTASGGTFASDGETIRVRYVGPYFLETIAETAAPDGIRRSIEQRISRRARVSEKLSGRLTGLVAASSVDRLGLNAEGGPLPNSRPALLDLKRGRVHVEFAPPRLGAVDFLHLLETRFGLGGELTDASVDALLDAAKAMSDEAERASAEFDRAFFGESVAMVGIDAWAEAAELLEATETLAAAAGEPHAAKLRAAATAWNEARGRRLKDAEAAAQAAETVLEEKRAASDAKSAAFAEFSSSLGAARAKAGDLVPRRQKLRDEAAKAEDAAHEAAEKLDRATTRFQEATAAGKPDVAVIREHREALSAKREADAAAETTRKELESVQAEIAANAAEIAALQEQMESQGQDLETALTEFEAAEAAAAAARAEVERLRGETELTPELRRALLKRRFGA